MMKLLLALLPLLALCSGQATELTNSQKLSDTFTIRWEVLSTPGDIVLEIEATTKGWVSFSITNPDGYRSDLAFAGFDTQNTYLSDMHFNLTSANPGLGHTTPLVDASNDLVLQEAYFKDPNTIVRFKRSLNTGDEDDTVIAQGSYLVGWAYGDQPNGNYTPSASDFYPNLVFIP